MNPAMIHTAYKVAKRAYREFAEYRDRKALEAYEALQDVGSEAEKVYNAAASKASSLADDAQKHLSNAVDEVKGRTEDVQDRLSDKPSKGARVAKGLAVIACLGAVAGAVYYFVLGSKKPAGTNPPTVEDFEEEGESRLVYSTQTPTEGVPERDSELLDALEEQLKDLDSSDDEEAEDKEEEK